MFFHPHMESPRKIPAPGIQREAVAFLFPIIPKAELPGGFENHRGIGIPVEQGVVENGSGRAVGAAKTSAGSMQIHGHGVPLVMIAPMGQPGKAHAGGAFPAHKQGNAALFQPEIQGNILAHHLRAGIGNGHGDSGIFPGDGNRGLSILLQANLRLPLGNDFPNARLADDFPHAIVKDGKGIRFQIVADGVPSEIDVHG